jgi:hypothetical protein
MGQPVETPVTFWQRSVRSWRILAAAGLVGTTLAWCGGLAGSGRVEAQQARKKREEPPARPRMQFDQAQIVYTRMGELIAEWEGKGWETYQVVPVFPANLASGRPMMVAIVFRRPAP